MKNQISITKSKIQADDEIITPKTKYSVRVVDMPPLIMQEVKNYINSLDEVPLPLFNITGGFNIDSILEYNQPMQYVLCPLLP